MGSQQSLGFGPLGTDLNPCVRVYGLGPEGATCKTCSHLVARRFYPKTYHKCDLRKMSACTATDHRVNWRACAKWQALDAALANLGTEAGASGDA